MHKHQAVLRVPEHEGFGDGLDRVAQPQVRLDRPLDQGLLLGDVDGDADEVRPASPGCCTSSQRARSHTQLPLAWRMRKAWSIGVALASASWAASS